MPNRHPVGPNDTHWCPDCKQFLGREAFYLNKKRWNGLSLYCKPCYDARHAAWRRSKGIPDRATYDARRRHPDGLCARCKEFKPLWKFRKHDRSASGLDYVCKDCYRAKKIREWWVTIKGDPARHAEHKKRINAYMRAYRYNVKTSDQEVRKRHIARTMVSLAISGGYLKRLPCEQCGNPKTQGHHDDYSKPLEVRWLCREHHDALHANHPDS